jgi:DivIVA domain-containing protein
MALKLLLDSNKIYHKVFEGSKPGYDALQVDSFLDLVIKDYDSFTNYVSTMEATITELKNKVDMLNKQLNSAEVENAKLNARLGDVSSNDDASLSNLELIKRIAVLEKALSNLGVDPKTLS